MKRLVQSTLLLGLFVGIVWWSAQRPSNNRAWRTEQARLPSASFSGDLVTVQNVRDFRHVAEADTVRSEPAWDVRTYDLSVLDSMWYVLSPFGTDWRGPAHAMLSFGFADTAFVSVSVEARKEVGESYSTWKGLLRRYELMYVVADERDVIGLRTNGWNDDVHVYPIRADVDKIRQIFVAMLERANELRDSPEFYDTLRKNCTTTLLDHANAVAERKIPGGWRVQLPGYSDALIHELGLIRSDEDLDGARARFRVNERAQKFADQDEFSRKIRQDID